MGARDTGLVQQLLFDVPTSTVNIFVDETHTVWRNVVVYFVLRRFSNSQQNRTAKDFIHEMYYNYRM